MLVGMNFRWMSLTLAKGKCKAFFACVFSLFPAFLPPVWAGKYCKSVVLITVDALRPDHLGCYGYVRKTSPFIDSLAKDGVLFTQAISTASWTVPSVSALLGRLPHELKAAGMRSAHFTSNPHTFEAGGLRGGFDEFNCRLPDSDAAITDACLAWLSACRGKPFFLWVHYMGPHAPYRPPMPYGLLYPQEEMGELLEIGAANGDMMDGNGVIPAYAALGTRRDTGFYISQYDGEISAADAEIGRLLKGIRKAGGRHDTLVIITADHGEALGEHGYYFGHGSSVYDELLRVPLVFYRTKTRQARRVDSQVSLVDVAPTVLELLGLKSEGGPGRSMAALMEGVVEPEPRTAYSERSFPGQPQALSVRSGGWKLIYNEAGKAGGVPEYELYDLERDPAETKNLYEMHRKEAVRLRLLLDGWKTGPQDVTVRLPEETRGILKSLGYSQ